MPLLQLQKYIANETTRYQPVWTCTAQPAVEISTTMEEAMCEGKATQSKLRAKNVLYLIMVPTFPDWQNSLTFPVFYPIFSVFFQCFYFLN